MSSNWATPADCELTVSWPSYLISCDCGGPWIGEFTAIPLDPGDELIIMVVPVLGALPALPGSDVNDALVFQFVPPSECEGDLTGDGLVGPADLAILLSAWGPNAGHPADFDGNGVVNAADLAALLSAWGQCD